MSSIIAKWRDRLCHTPNAAEFYQQLAMDFWAAGQLAAADRALAQALKLAPDRASFWVQRSALAHQLGNIQRAATDQWRALELNPQLVSSRDHLQLGNQLAQQGKLAQARQCYEWAIAQDHQCWEAYFNWGWVAQKSQDFAAEVQAYQRAIAQGCPDARLPDRLAQAWARLGKAAYLDRAYDQSIQAYQNALSLNSQQASYWSDLGCALTAVGQWSEAETAHQKAIALDPQTANYYYNLGNFYWKKADYFQAISAFQNAIQCNLQDAKSHWNLSHILLALGQFTEGFREYEWRWATVQPPPKLPHPQWQGESLHGRTILLQAEQGLGDSLQFIRYANLLASSGASVWFSGPAVLHRLFAQLPAIDRVLPVLEPGQILPGVDYRSPLLSLPHQCKTDWATIPNQIPYLTVDPAWPLPPPFKELPAKPKKIGIVWASGYRVEDELHDIYLDKSLPCELLLKALQEFPVMLYSLQVGKNAQDYQPLMGQFPDLNLVDCSPWIQDFADTAAICQQLDLLISVDTSVVHLAGGLGKPTWVLLPARCDWRWLLDRPDSPWYPTMRLFRQAKPGDWSEPLQQVRSALSNWLTAS